MNGGSGLGYGGAVAQPDQTLSSATDVMLRVPVGDVNGYYQRRDGLEGEHLALAAGGRARDVVRVGVVVRGVGAATLVIVEVVHLAVLVLAPRRGCPLVHAGGVKVGVRR